MKTKNKFVIEDRLLLAAFTSMIATTAGAITLYLMNLFLPGHTVNMTTVALKLFLDLGPYTLLHRILAYLWTLIIGGIYIFIYLVMLDWTGWRKIWLKSLIIMTAIWVFPGGIIMKLLKLMEATRDEPLSVTAFFFAHFFFATYVFVLVKMFGVPKEVK